MFLTVLKIEFKSVFTILPFKIKEQNIYSLCPLLFCSRFMRNFCSSVDKSHSFPIHEIRNLNYIPPDKDKWDKVVGQILQAKEHGWNLPTSLKLSDIDELLDHKSNRQRFKYLTFLFKKEQKKLANIEKKRRKKLECENNVSENNENNHIKYGLGKNTLLLAFRRHSFHKYYNYRLANSLLFGQNLVIDLGYDEFMWKKERRDCAAQLRLVHSINRNNIDPYNLYFCNANAASYCMRYLQQEMPNVDDSLISITEKSYLDIFPQENLVYLSPHASETLPFYDHKAVYIIGGFVDIVKKENISFHKAEKEGIKSYSLPLDDHVLWGCGSKSLSINQVFQILLTMRDTGDWLQAFKHIPTRKIQRLKPVESDFIPDKIFLMDTSRSKV